MFGIEFGELLIILVVALLVFGPDRLPVMAKQAASFIRDLRTMVAKARTDLSDSVGDLGIDQEDLRTFTDLRNPKSYVRSKVLDGVDLGIDDLELEKDFDLNDDGKPAAKKTAARKTTAKKATAKKPAARKSTAKKPARTTAAATNGAEPNGDTPPAGNDGLDVTAAEAEDSAPVEPIVSAPFDPDAT